MTKTHFWLKPTKNAKTVYVNIKYHSLLWNHPTEPWCKMLETLKIQRKNIVCRNCQWNKFYMSNLKVTKGLIMTWGPKVHPSLVYRWDSKWQTFNSVRYVLSQCQPPHMKKRKIRKIVNERILLWFTPPESISG